MFDFHRKNNVRTDSDHKIGCKFCCDFRAGLTDHLERAIRQIKEDKMEIMHGVDLIVSCSKVVVRHDVLEKYSMKSGTWIRAGVGGARPSPCQGTRSAEATTNDPPLTSTDLLVTTTAVHKGQYAHLITPPLFQQFLLVAGKHPYHWNLAQIYITSDYSPDFCYLQGLPTRIGDRTCQTDPRGRRKCRARRIRSSASTMLG